MASVASGQSPHSGYDFNSNNDETESWQFLDMSSNPGSLGFYSPETGSLHSYAIIGPNPNQPQDQQQQQQQQQQPRQPQASSPAGVSPVLLQGHLSGGYPPSTFPGSDPSLSVAASDAFPGASLACTTGGNSHVLASADPSGMDIELLMAQSGLNSATFAQHFSQMDGKIDWPRLPTATASIEQVRMLNTIPATDLSPILDGFGAPVTMPQGLDQMNLPSPAPLPGEAILDFGLGENMQTATTAPPWTPNPLSSEDGVSPGVGAEGFIMPPQFPVQQVQHHHQQQQQQQQPPTSHPSPGNVSGSASVSRSPSSSMSAGSPGPMASASGGRKKASASPTSTDSPKALRKTARSGVEKSRKKGDISPSAAAAASQFVIVTPNTISAHAGKPNMFECFEAMRPSARGRKGPLANDTKENALQVRRLGACFCCHARKVKCDKERPCKNCKKLTIQVPDVVCWQFQDFLPVLFPEFVRGHFRKEEMSKFIRENIEGFTIQGIEKPCEVELSSGFNFSAKLRVKAKFFTARTSEVLQHWHVNVRGNEMGIESVGSAPIGVELDGPTREDLRKRLKEYIGAIVQEPYYAEQLTDSFRHTLLPQRILKIIHGYNRAAEQAQGIVRKALGIYGMHYILSRHLTLTKRSVEGLSHTSLVPRNVPWVTPRVLNRQIKSLVDEMLLKEMTGIFELISKLLKPKTKREWAPCLAAFLVLCLYMEEVETAADRFVISQNEICLRNGGKREYTRGFALKVNREVEKLPFRQVAYQFHQIYQTHSKDGLIGGTSQPGGLGGNGGKAFNPLVDDVALEELDGPATEMVLRLRELITGEDWAELDFLSMDPMLPAEGENHPYPRDISYNYTGRLVSKFLLSFLQENYILDGNI